MSDFDDVLERLLSDEGFKAALAADPARALAGYRLTPEELDLLRAQVSTDSGGGAQRVEQRTSKASLFGLASALEGFGGHGGGHGVFASASEHGASASAGHVSATAGDRWIEEPPTRGIGEAPPVQGIGEAPPHQGLAASIQAGAAAAGSSGTGPTTTDHGGTFGAVGEQLSHVQQGHLQAPAPPPVPPGYHPHIDVDGDGHWDAYTVRSRADGGVDLVADMNHDGRPDFVGHDYNRDGLVDAADYDKDHDGVFENHQYDVNGDGWLDRSVTDPKPAPEIPPAVAEQLRFGAGE
jgi:hypothetical protein